MPGDTQPYYYVVEHEDTDSTLNFSGLKSQNYTVRINPGVLTNDKAMTDWCYKIMVPKFNKPGNRLVSVRVSYRGAFVGSLGYEHVGNVIATRPTTASVTRNAMLGTLCNSTYNQLSGLTNDNFNCALSFQRSYINTAHRTYNLVNYDGKLDFAGTSGQTFDPLQSFSDELTAQYNTAGLDPASTTATFTNPGNLGFFTYSASNSAPFSIFIGSVAAHEAQAESANMAYRHRSRAQADYQVEYLYMPTAIGDCPTAVGQPVVSFFPQSDAKPGQPLPVIAKPANTATTKNFLVIKKYAPFRFEKSSAATYQVTRSGIHPTRVWNCAIGAAESENICNFTKAFEEDFTIDLSSANTSLKGCGIAMIIIDDDADGCINSYTVSNGSTSSTSTVPQAMTTTLYFAPNTGKITFSAKDSGGIVNICKFDPAKRGVKASGAGYAIQNVNGAYKPVEKAGFGRGY